MRTIKFRAWYSDTMLEVGTLDFFVDGQITVNEELVGAKIMQFTGLLDKNGKEIYEGDIVQTEHSITKEKYHHEIIFEGGAFRLASGGMYWNDWEILGNIYENPELLHE